MNNQAREQMVGLLLYRPPSSGSQSGACVSHDTFTESSVRDVVAELINAQASYVEGQDFKIQPSQSNNLPNLLLSLSCLLLGITNIGQVLVSSESG